MERAEVIGSNPMHPGNCHKSFSLFLTSDILGVHGCEKLKGRVTPRS